jgi:hypothetical protein
MMKPIRFEFEYSAGKRDAIAKLIRKELPKGLLPWGFAARDIPVSARISFANSEALPEIVSDPVLGVLVVETLIKIYRIAKVRYSGQPSVGVLVEFVPKGR